MSLQIATLTKTFGEQTAVDAISFSLVKGEIVGFLGPNGSGKTTTMKCICGILPPSSGQVKVAGTDVQEQPLEVKKILGYLPEHNPLPTDMYVVEYLQHIDGFYNSSKNRSKRIADTIELTGLGKEHKKKIGQLSKGYRQRVGLAQAIIHDPQVLILDEPTTGLDPNQLVEIRNLISGLSREKTVLLSTHILQEVEAICDRVLVLHQGKLVADGSSQTLSQEYNTLQTILLEFSSAIDQTLLQQLPGITKLQQVQPNKFLLESNYPDDLREIIFKLCVDHKLGLLTLQKKEETLEETFRKLTTHHG